MVSFGVSAASAADATTGKGDAAVAAESNADEKKCRWWQVGCDDRKESIEGLPPEVPREGTIITVDTTKNVAYLFRDGELVSQGPVATGSEKLLKKGIRKWLFRTPRGRHKVLRKIVDPVWTKPDWAFIEEGKPVPALDSPKRKVKGKLGKYALDLGDGILIHGTRETDSLGKKASHGCIRMGDELLEQVYKTAVVGTDVFIF